MLKQAERIVGGCALILEISTPINANYFWLLESMTGGSYIYLSKIQLMLLMQSDFK